MIKEINITNSEFSSNVGNPNGGMILFADTSLYENITIRFNNDQINSNT